MIISSGIMKVSENNNKKIVKFFGEVEVGDVIEVRVNLNVHTTRRVSDKLVTVHNLTKNTSRTDAPTYIDLGLTKMVLEPLPQINEAEYQRGYNEAYNELHNAYNGGYIEELFEEDESEGK